jgi:hypothetical protein
LSAIPTPTAKREDAITKSFVATRQNRLASMMEKTVEILAVEARQPHPLLLGTRRAPICLSPVFNWQLSKLFVGSMK